MLFVLLVQGEQLLDLKTGPGRGKMNLIDNEISDFIDLRVAGGIDFQHIHTIAAGDLVTGRASVTRLQRWPLLATQGLGEDPRGRSLSSPPGATKEISPGRRIGSEDVAQRAHDRVLAE